MADSDYKPPFSLDTLGFHLPKAYVLRSGWWLEEFHIMPKAGGLDCQDLRWVEDMEKLFNGKRRAQRDVDDEKEELRKMKNGN